MGQENCGLVIALDDMNAKSAKTLLSTCRAIACEMSPQINVIPKLGLEMIYRAFSEQNGYVELIKREKARRSFFLDAKLWDIPQTVRLAAEAAAKLSPTFMTVRDEPGCIEAACKGVEVACEEAGDKCKILAVSVLTNLEAEKGELARRAKAAQEAGAAGIIASPHEVREIRKAVSDTEFLILTPGIRFKGAPKDDQKRIATPHFAFEQGADYIIVGRPITKAENPELAIREILASISGNKAGNKDGAQTKSQPTPARTPELATA